MSLRVGFFPQNNSLWVLRHRGILERSVGDVEWVNLRELPGGGRGTPSGRCPRSTVTTCSTAATTSSGPVPPRR